eukprot:515992-Rhodomonas_salina.2
MKHPLHVAGGVSPYEHRPTVCRYRAGVIITALWWGPHRQIANRYTNPWYNLPSSGRGADSRTLVPASPRTGGQSSFVASHNSKTPQQDSDPALATPPARRGPRSDSLIKFSDSESPPRHLSVSASVRTRQTSSWAVAERAACQPE